MACALHLLTLGHPRQVIVAGTRGAPDTEALVDAAFHSFTPGGALRCDMMPGTVLCLDGLECNTLLQTHTVY